MKSTRILGIRKNRKIYILHTGEVRNVYFLADVSIFSFTYHQYINQRMQVSNGVWVLDTNLTPLCKRDTGA